MVFPTISSDNINFFTNAILPKHIVDSMDLDALAEAEALRKSHQVSENYTRGSSNKKKIIRKKLFAAHPRISVLEILGCACDNNLTTHPTPLLSADE